MKLTFISVAALVVLSIGAATLRMWTLARTARPSPFACLATTNDGWLTVSADEVNLHVDWQNADGHVDGVPGYSGISDAEHARELAVSLTEPFAQTTATAHSAARLSVFAMCDGVPHSWAGTSVVNPTWRSCLGLHPRTVVQCMREVLTTPRAVSEAEAWEVSKKAHELSGHAMPAEPEDDVLPHLGSPFVTDD